MFHKALEKLKKKFEHSEVQEPALQEENSSILEYLDTHGIENKDKDVEVPHQSNNSNLKEELKKKLIKSSKEPSKKKSHTNNTVKGENEILKYLDTFGIIDKDSQQETSSPNNPLIDKESKEKLTKQKEITPSREKQYEIEGDEEDWYEEESASNKDMILEYIDRNGVISKDLEEALQEDTVHNEEVFQNSNSSTNNTISEKDAKRLILEYVDQNGIEVKESDLSKRQKSESDIVRSKKAREKVVDLHGKTTEEAHRIIKNAFYSAKERGYNQILIIHGKGLHSRGGVSVIKKFIHRLLETDLAVYVSTYHYAPPKDGGSGATRVVLK